MEIRNFQGACKGRWRPETILVRFGSALNTKDILGGLNGPSDDQNYILGNYERALTGPKQNYRLSGKVLVATKEILGDLKGPRGCQIREV